MFFILIFIPKFSFSNPPSLGLHDLNSPTED